MKENKSRAKYLNKYEKEHYKRVVSLIRMDDEKVIKKLDSVESINSYVYELIKKDVYRGENNE